MSTTQPVVEATILGQRVRARVVDEVWTPRFNAQHDRRYTVDVNGRRFVVSPDQLDEFDPR